MTDVAQALCEELDTMVEHARGANLSAHQLLDLQAQIAGIRYTLSTYMVLAEQSMLAEKDRRDLHLVKETLRLQAMDAKLSTAKAQDRVNGSVTMEQIRQSVLQTKIAWSGIKVRLDHSGDMLVSVAQRIKRLEEEAKEARIQSQRHT